MKFLLLFFMSLFSSIISRSIRHGSSPPISIISSEVVEAENRAYLLEKNAESHIVYDRTGQHIHKRPEWFDLEPSDESGNDMRLTPQQRQNLFGGTETSKRKMIAAIGAVELWKDGVIPWKFDAAFPEEQRQKVREITELYQRTTCLRMPEIGGADGGGVKPKNYLSFVKGKGCWSWLGNAQKGEQQISLGAGCKTIGTMAHELGHAIGFYHEHSRSDRDSYVKVRLENVKKGMESNFDKVQSSVNYAPYDENSMMHYGSHAFSANGNPTLGIIKPELEFLIGQRDIGPTFYDFQAINTAYECSKKCAATKCYNGGYLDHLCQCRCPTGLTGTNCQDFDASAFNPYCSKVKMLNDDSSFILDYTRRPISQSEDMCAWVFISPPGTTLALTFEVFNIPCSDVELEIRFNLPGQRGPKVCGDKAPQKSFSTDRHKQPQLSMFLKRWNKVVQHKAVQFKARIEVKGKINGSPKTLSVAKRSLTHRHGAALGKMERSLEMNQRVVENFDNGDISEFIQEGDWPWTTISDGTTSAENGLSGEQNGRFYAYFYAYFPTSSSVNPGDTAILTSKTFFSGLQSICMDFFYNLYGSSAGTLQVRTLTDDGNYSVLFRSSGGTEQRNWQYIKISLPKMARPYRIQIVGTRGEQHGNNDMAISHIRIRTTPCIRDGIRQNRFHSRSLV